jgi:hypothetical protein
MKHFLLNITLLFIISNCYAQESYQKPNTIDRQEDEFLGWSTSIFKDYAAAGAPHHTIVSDNDTLKEAGAVTYLKKISKENGCKHKGLPIKIQNLQTGLALL